MLGPLPADDPQADREARVAEAVRVWQSLVVGAARFNPVTDEAMVAQTLSVRMNVVEIIIKSTQATIYVEFMLKSTV